MPKASVTRMTSARIPTEYGELQLCYYANTVDDKAHLAFYHGDINQKEDVLVRVHSECFTGDVMKSRRCDCGEQLDQAMRRIIPGAVVAFAKAKPCQRYQLAQN